MSTEDTLTATLAALEARMTRTEARHDPVKKAGRGGKIAVGLRKSVLMHTIFALPC